MADRRGQSLSAGFWKGVVIETPDNPGACWAWSASTNHDGYGKFNSHGKVIAAHRASYELHFGEIPAGKQVMHSCDNPPCTNPRHLTAGTRKENMQDAAAKGKFSRPRRPWIPATEEQKAQILSSTLPKRATARLVGVDPSTVRKVLSENRAH